MQFVVKRDILLKSLNFVQGVVEKKNTLPILSNVLLQLKNKKLSIYLETSKMEKYARKITSSVASYIGSDRTGSDVEK